MFGSTAVSSGGGDNSELVGESVGDSLSDGEALSDDADSLADGDADWLSLAVALGDGAHALPT